MDRYWPSLLSYQLGIVFQLYFHFDSVYGVVFDENFWNLLFRVIISGSSVILFICGPILPVSSVIPSFSIQSKPNRGLVFFVVISISRLFLSPFISTEAVVFPSNFIRLSFTSLYSVPIGRNGVILLNCDFGIKVTGEPLSIMNLIGRLFTNAVMAKNSGPFFLIWRVEWSFWFTEWNVFGDQSSSSALLATLSCMWFILLYVLQYLA